MKAPSTEDPRPPAPPPASSAGELDVTLCREDARGAMSTLLRSLPMALAVREIIRMRALAESGSLRLPLLDVGCGDGLFWEVLTRDLKAGRAGRFDGLVGIDIDPHELELASLRLSEAGGQVRRVDISDAGQNQDLEAWTDGFETVLANCSLEHVPRLEESLRHIKRYLAPEGELFLFVPAPNWSDTLVSKRCIARVSRRFAGLYGGLFDGFFQHHHLYPAWVWRQLLEGLGFETRIQALGSAVSNHLGELWLPPSLISFVFKAVFKRYPARLTAPFKALYLSRMKDFLREIETGAVISDDLEHPEVIEYSIRCRHRSGRSDASF